MTAASPDAPRFHGRSAALIPNGFRYQGRGPPGRPLANKLGRSAAFYLLALLPYPLSLLRRRLILPLRRPLPADEIERLRRGDIRRLKADGFDAFFAELFALHAELMVAGGDDLFIGLPIARQRPDQQRLTHRDRRLRVRPGVPGLAPRRE